jgi:hypothetical protein
LRQKYLKTHTSWSSYSDSVKHYDVVYKYLDVLKISNFTSDFKGVTRKLTICNENRSKIHISLSQVQLFGSFSCSNVLQIFLNILIGVECVYIHKGEYSCVYVSVFVCLIPLKTPINYEPLQNSNLFSH